MIIKKIGISISEVISFSAILFLFCLFLHLVITEAYKESEVVVSVMEITTGSIVAEYQVPRRDVSILRSKLPEGYYLSAKEIENE